MGGLVTSHGVGMAVPDWPNTYGYNMFFFPVSQWVGGIFYEHTHRLVASGGRAADGDSGAVALWAKRPPVHALGRRWRCSLLGLATVAGRPPAMDGWRGAWGRRAGVCWARASFGRAASRARNGCGGWGSPRSVAVVLQGVLGGLRVVLFKDAIGIFHATLAQLFFVLVCAIALFTSRWWQAQGARVEGRGADLGSRTPARLRWLFVATSALILGQLILGATMRHQHAGLAIPDFPLAYGKLWPAMDAASVASYNQQRMEVLSANPITAFQIVLQMIHRLLALAILGAVAFCAWSTRRALAREKYFEPADAGLAGADTGASASGSGNDLVEQGGGHRHRPRAGRCAVTSGWAQL